jgi:diacylglycerol kinase family enzyme
MATGQPGYYEELAAAQAGTATTVPVADAIPDWTDRGMHLPHCNIAELRVSRVRVEADPALLIEANGEVLGTTPARFEVIPGAIRIKV